LYHRVMKTAVLIALLFTCLMGCGRSAGLERVAVKGMISFNQQPLKSGRITFVPAEGTKGPSAVATIKEGAYQFDRLTGPVSGKNRIQIEALPEPGFELDDEAAYAKAAESKNGMPVLPPQAIPPEYNERSTLLVTVSPKGEKKFDFSLPNAAPSSAP
jgi:hypothetical protein